MRWQWPTLRLSSPQPARRSLALVTIPVGPPMANLCLAELMVEVVLSCEDQRRYKRSPCADATARAEPPSGTSKAAFAFPGQPLYLFPVAESYSGVLLAALLRCLPAGRALEQSRWERELMSLLSAALPRSGQLWRVLSHHAFDCSVVDLDDLVHQDLIRDGPPVTLPGCFRKSGDGPYLYSTISRPSR